MAEAQFMPAQTDPAGQFYRGADFGQSFMQRRQRIQWETQDRARDEEIRRAVEPVFLAKQEATLASARATISTITQQEMLKKRLAQEAPIANAEYQAAMQLPTFEEQEKALARIQPKYTWMSQLDEGKPFVDQLNQSRAMAFKSAITDTEIKARTELSKIQYAQELEKLGVQNQGRIDLEKERQKRPAASSSVQGLIQSRDEALDVGDTETAAILDGVIAKRSAAVRRPGDSILDLRRQANEIRATDPQGAAMLDQRAESLSKGGSGGANYLQQLAEFLGTQNATNPAPSTPNTQTTQPQVTPTTVNVFEGINFR
jgi:hypothetical protein